MEDLLKNKNLYIHMKISCLEKERNMYILCIAFILTSRTPWLINPSHYKIYIISKNRTHKDNVPPSNKYQFLQSYDLQFHWYLLLWDFLFLNSSYKPIMKELTTLTSYVVKKKKKFHGSCVLKVPGPRVILFTHRNAMRVMLYFQ